MAKFKFTRDFQIGILTYMINDYDFLLLATDVIQPEYFEDNVLVYYFQKIRNYFVDYKQKVTLLVLENELTKTINSKIIKDHEVQAYKDVFTAFNKEVESKDYVITEMVRFCRRQAVRKAMLEAAPLTDSEAEDVWDKIESNMRDACNVGSHAVDIGVQYFLQYPERLNARLLGDDRTVIPTGITELDSFIGGGLKSGQLGIWLGPTSAGKSVALTHCGKRALVQGCKVVHYTCELYEQDVADRYDSSWTNVPMNQLADKHVLVDQKLGKLNTKYGNSLIIKYFPAGTTTVQGIKSHIQMLHNHGFNPDLVIVDYGDLLKATTHYKDEYSDLGIIFRDLHGLAGELRVPLWTASQANRAGLNAEIVDLEHIGDSIRKVQIADLVIGMCRTQEEYELGIMRLFVAKNKNGPEKVIVKIHNDFSRMCFYDPVKMSVQNNIQNNPPPGVASTPVATTGRRKPKV